MSSLWAAVPLLCARDEAVPGLESPGFRPHLGIHSGLPPFISIPGASTIRFLNSHPGYGHRTPSPLNLLPLGASVPPPVTARP